MCEIAEGRERIFESPLLMPPFRGQMSDYEYEINWLRFVSKLQKADLLLTMDSKSFVSRIIAGVAGGVWSHAAIYDDDMNLYESVSKGVIKASLVKYKKKHVHIGAYRLFEGLTIEQQDQIVGRVRNLLGSRYNYWGALMCGIRTRLDMELGTFAPTPNGLIYNGDYYLVEYV